MKARAAQPQRWHDLAEVAAQPAVAWSHVVGPGEEEPAGSPSSSAEEVHG